MGAPTQTLYLTNSVPLLFLMLTQPAPLPFADTVTGLEVVLDKLKLLLLSHVCIPLSQFSAEKLFGEPEQINDEPLMVGSAQAVTVNWATIVPPTLADSVAVPTPLRVTVVGLPVELTVKMLLLLTVQLIVPKGGLSNV